MNADTETTLLRDYIQQWFATSKQETLNSLLDVIWDELTACDYTIAEVLRSFAQYAHRSGKRRAVAALEEAAIELEESLNLNDDSEVD